MEFNKKEFKLFMLSGKARSGKDTVANIIKDYYDDKKTIIISFGHYIKDYAKRVSDWDGSEDTKPRELLQQLGIELIKNNIDNTLFIRRIIEDIEVFSYFYDIIIIDDVRLIDEIEILKEKYKDSISIRIIRNNYNNKLTDKENNHITEIDLDNYNNFDYVIENNNNLDELNKQLEDVLRSV
jgi:dephospho-CoA kinase